MPVSDITALNAGAILIVPFPYSDQLSEKRRPALMISNRALLRDHRLVWVAMITSAKNVSRSSDVPVPDLERAGLPAASVVRPAKIACMDPDRILRVAGRIEGRTLSAVRTAVAGFLKADA